MLQMGECLDVVHAQQEMFVKSWTLKRDEQEMQVQVSKHMRKQTIRDFGIPTHILKI